MKIIESPEVITTIRQNPTAVVKPLLFLRQLIIEVAMEMDNTASLTETLKWGEPSYLTKNGSTIRISWKSSKPEQYAMYFNCKTLLLETFKELYKDTFEFEGNRAIVFKLSDTISVNELEHCISLALAYHRLKHLPLLGV